MATKTVVIAGATYSDVPGIKVSDGTNENYAVFTDDADASASDIASGKTAYVNGEKITGAMNPFVKDLSDWTSVDLSRTQSGLWTTIVAAAGNAKFTQETANSRIWIRYSNNGSTSGFLIRMPVNDGLAVHFSSASTIWTNTSNHNNWFALGFDDASYTTYITTVNPFDFGWSSNRSWSTLAMFFANGGWMVADGTDCYFLDDDYNVIAHKTVTSVPTNLWFSDQRSDTGSLNVDLYIDQIKTK